MGKAVLSGRAEASQRSYLTEDFGLEDVKDKSPEELFWMRLLNFGQTLSN